MDRVVALPLAGRNIVITRPVGQAAHMAEALLELGANPVLFPVLAIFDIDDPRPLQDVAIRVGRLEQPRVLKDCVGCGLCERSCIQIPQAIRIIPDYG